MNVAADGRRAAMRVRPTPFGVLAAVVVLTTVAVGPAVVDPQMAGFVWAASLGLLIVGAVWPVVVLTVLSVSGDDGCGRTDPRPGADRPVRRGAATSVAVRVGRRLGEVEMRVGDRDGGVALPVGADVVAEVGFVARCRGRFDRIPVQLRCDAPFGVVVASRIVPVAPPRPLVVGPARVAVGDVEVPAAAGQGDAPVAAVGHGGDTVRSVRPYVSGDPAHLVHWPTTARTGALVVRELEPPSTRAVVVVVDLGPGDGDGAPTGIAVTGAGDPTGSDRAAVSSAPGVDGGLSHLIADGDPSRPTPEAEQAREAVVARAAATTEVFLERGIRVVVCSSGPGPRTGDVADRDALLTRLAGATVGPTGPPPPGWPVLRFSTRPGGVDRG